MNQGNRLQDCADDWMSRHPMTLLGKESVQQAAALMMEHRIGSIIIKDKNVDNVFVRQPGKVRGIVTDTDIVRKVVAAGLSPTLTSIAKIMSGPPIVVGNSYPLFEIIRTLKNNKIKRVPVMKGEELAGIITITDVLHALVKLGKLYDLGDLVSFVARREIEQPKFENAMNIQLWMTKSIITVHRYASLLEAAKLMEQNKFGCLPVVNDFGMLVGIITDTDLVRKVVAQGIPVSEPLEQIMTKNVITAESDKTLGFISELMTRHSIKRVPIVDNAKMVGIISSTDIINIFLQLNNFAEAHKIIEMMYSGSAGAW